MIFILRLYAIYSCSKHVVAGGVILLGIELALKIVCELGPRSAEARAYVFPVGVYGRDEPRAPSWCVNRGTVGL